MSEYAFADIITGKDILTDQVKDEDIIGTKGYFAGDLKTIVDSFDDNTFPDSLLEGTLETVSYIGRFRRKEDGIYFDYFIRKKEQSYKERQAEWVEKVDLKPGDKVRILRKFDDCEQGFHCGMNSEGQMDCLVGKVVEVREIDARSICLYNEDKSDWWVWPYFCLEKVEPEYVPFDLSKEEDRDAIRGKWVQDSRHGNEWMIVGFYLDETGGQGYKAKLSRKNAGFTGSELLERFTFLDGTPIGKLKEAGA